MSDQNQNPTPATTVALSEQYERCKPTGGDMILNLSNGKNSTMKRSKAIKYYKLTLYMANLFSKDPSTKVGACFLFPDTLQILSLGYNGMPRGVLETDAKRWERPIKYKYTEHAERNAIYNAAQSGTSLRDSICVASMFPCSDCTRGIIQSGCKMIITKDISDVIQENPEVGQRWIEDWNISMDMMLEAGVNIMFLKNDEL